MDLWDGYIYSQRRQMASACVACRCSHPTTYTTTKTCPVFGAFNANLPGNASWPTAVAGEAYIVSSVYDLACHVSGPKVDLALVYGNSIGWYLRHPVPLRGGKSEPRKVLKVQTQLVLIFRHI